MPLGNKGAYLTLGHFLTHPVTVKSVALDFLSIFNSIIGQKNTHCDI